MKSVVLDFKPTKKKEPKTAMELFREDIIRDLGVKYPQSSKYFTDLYEQKLGDEFTDDLLAFFYEKKYLTQKQLKALEKVYMERTYIEEEIQEQEYSRDIALLNINNMLAHDPELSKFIAIKDPNKKIDYNQLFQKDNIYRAEF